MKHRIRVRKPLTVEEQVSLTTDYNAGMLIRDIAQKYNISHSTVHNVVNKEIEREKN